ncbi:hypothetical protein CPAV1605_492 [seawater metagenome]|uniref:Core domain-containing protein n=1 Tax=seawater metagenome TaxID=1561972 RepID=A0A5E8CI64_9ZZZZ
MLRNLTNIYVNRFFSTQTSTSIVNITNTAWEKINDILLKSNSQGMLFSIKSGGCNGFNYNFEVLNDKNSDLLNNKLKPTCIENDSSKVYIDPLAEMYLIGTTIDYIKEDYSKGVYENKFVYIADKERATNCGCGVSFSPKI